MTTQTDPDTTEHVVRLATEVMGWTVLPGHQFSTGVIAATEGDGRVRLSGEGFIAKWNPFTDANADLQVLERVRETWGARDLGKAAQYEPRFRLFVESLQRQQGFVPISHLNYSRGDYARAALKVLNQETR